MTVKASILAIGTELTQGQITNRNAAWISEKLTDLGFQVVLHSTVSDDQSEILDALEHAAARSDLLIVTGGLGPTTDDFTRDVISNWMGSDLVYREASWQKILKRLTDLGIEVAESNRRQCFFPTGSEVFENLDGTADAFRFRKVKIQLPPGQTFNLEGAQTEVLVLPGPPSEGKSLWDRHVTSWLMQAFPSQPKESLESWQCLGKSESSLGEIVEKALEGFELKIGYRASVPYVEVKVWFSSNYPRERKFTALAKLNAELAPYSVARNGEDLGEKLMEALASHTGDVGLTFIDFGSDGILTHRLLDVLKTPAGRNVSDRVEIMTRYAQTESPEELPESANEWMFVLFANGRVTAIGPQGKFSRDLPSPYSSNAMIDRTRRYRAELALKAWAEMLYQAGGN
ncbi:MAG: competence/damage-inducible protein A [Cryobacterium sp.]|nr:competence/damage-inducible protein A [Oligoflexia bacterium]